MLKTLVICLISLICLTEYAFCGNIFQNDTLTCYTCSGSSCNQPLRAKEQCSKDDTMCVTLFDSTGSVVRRGCRNSMNPDERTKCRNEKDKNCFFCFSSDCNNAQRKTEFIDCVYCMMSSKSNCVEGIDEMERRKCQKSCMVALRPFESNDGHTYSDAYATYRGCLNDKPETDRAECVQGSDLCKSCNTPGCNTFQRPAEQRLTCYKCANKDCTKAEVKVCPLYRKDDFCVTVYREDRTNILALNCDSSISDSYKLVLRAKLRYSSCKGPNCNKLH